MLEAIESFETLYDKNQNSIEDYRPKHDYLILSDSEGKYFNIYAWLRVGGVIKKYDFKNPIYVYFNLEGLKSGKIEFSNASPDEEFHGPKENIYKPHEDASQSGKWFRIPKLELTEDIETSQKTLCHLGNVVVRGCNYLSCLLTLIYLKWQLKLRHVEKRLILVFGDRDVLKYDDELCFYNYLLHESHNKINTGDIIRKICIEAIKAQYMVLFTNITTKDKKYVCLTHKALTNSAVNKKYYWYY